MSAEKEIDANIEKFLNTIGTSMKNYEMPVNKEAMRKAMRDIMSKSYIKGSNDAVKAFWGD